MNKDCPCRSDCVRHGNCEACQQAHRAKGSLTACEKRAQEKQDK